MTFLNGWMGNLGGSNSKVRGVQRGLLMKVGSSNCLCFFILSLISLVLVVFMVEGHKDSGRT